MGGEIEIEELALDDRPGHEAYAALWNAVLPRYPITPDELERSRARRPDDVRLVGRVEWAVAGCAAAVRSDIPERTYMGVVVLPEHRGRGLGRAFLERTVVAARIHGSTILAAGLEEGDDAGAAFAARFGLTEVLRELEIALQLKGDAGVPQIPAEIQILALEDRPALVREAYALACEALPEMPLHAAFEMPSFERWVEEDATGPDVLGGGTLVALDAGRVVGFAGLSRRAADPLLAEHGLTFVAASYRNRGIATALKQSQIAWAAAQRLSRADDVHAARERADATRQRQARIRGSAGLDPRRGVARHRRGGAGAMTALRVASDDELETYVEIWNAVTPEEPVSVEQQRRRRDRDERRLYLLAEDAGEMIGCGFAGPSQSPGRGFLSPRVLPSARRRGTGAELLRALVAHLRGAGFELASAFVDGRDEGSLLFANRYGFEEVDRQVEQVKAVGVEPGGSAPDGVRFVTIAERPELLRESYGLALEGYEDFATAQPVTITLDEWLEEEATLPAGSFVALAGDEIVGYSGLCRRPDGVVEDGLTVVRRAWRRRGLAEALKRAELAWAGANGVTEIVTWTQKGNDAMRALNERLGYAYGSVSITVRGRVDELAL